MGLTVSRKGDQTFSRKWRKMEYFNFKQKHQPWNCNPSIGGSQPFPRDSNDEDPGDHVG